MNAARNSPAAHAEPNFQDRQVVFLLSDMRSGSTLLDQLLGAHPDVISLGEMHWLSAYATQDRTLYNPDHDLVCTCGKTLSECAFWSKVASELDKPMASLQLRPDLSPIARRLLERYPALFRYRPLQAYLAGASMVPDNLAVINAVFDVSGRRTLVDSSKSPLRFRAIFDAKPTQVRALILTRDYRAVVYSKMKRGHTMKSAAVGWRTRMRQIATLTDDLPRDHVHLASYERLCSDPQATLQELCEFLGLAFSSLMLERSQVDSHHIGGSPSKFNSARSTIVFDKAYQQAFTRRQLADLDQIISDSASRWGY